MCRVAPALLVCLLACTSAAQADDAFPALDQRLGKTITVVEKNFPTEKAVITQVWRLADGTPVMQARTNTSKTELTLVENTKATTAAERIKLYRWVNGVRPTGCPVAPVAADAAVKQVSHQVPVDGDKVQSVDGGLIPLLPKSEVAKPVVSAPVTSQPVKTEVAPVRKEVAAPAMIKSTVSVPVVPTQVPVTVQAAPVQTTPAPAAATTRELVGGCEVITITENGKARKYKVLGTARDAHGVMTHRCQALDNNEVVTLNCDSCGTACAPKAACAPVACAPAPVKCEPCKPACPPVVAKTECKPCEPAKVACDPCKTVAAPVKVCDPCATKPCATTKACDPCATAKACDPCATAKACDSTCAATKCATCGGPEGSCDACSKHGVGHGHSRGHRGHRVREDEINVPVPGVHLAAVNGTPGGPPPQPLVPAFCTMNSSSIRCYLNAPNVVPYYCLNQPFGDGMNDRIMAGIHQMNPGNGDAVANTMQLINVLAQSREWENRQWAAQRLEQATLPTVRPYVEDALLTAAHHDRAPLVKVAAIRTLASMKSTRPEVLNMLAHASVDMDPRVKEAANDVISSMMKAGMIQQAGYSK